MVPILPFVAALAGYIIDEALGTAPNFASSLGLIGYIYWIRLTRNAILREGVFSLRIAGMGISHTFSLTKNKTSFITAMVISVLVINFFVILSLDQIIYNVNNYGIWHDVINVLEFAFLSPSVTLQIVLSNFWTLPVLYYFWTACRNYLRTRNLK